MASNGIESMQLGEDQIKILEENFNRVSKHPDESTLMLIAAESGLTEEETAEHAEQCTGDCGKMCRANPASGEIENV
uniref:Homeodomain-only protein n=1 Tax=Oncorhynchus tshawytscha TaxID=74940 RepID=A0AAZ3RAJ1_ONCTS